jgi:Flp pilus assembly protein TadD
LAAVAPAPAAAQGSYSPYDESAAAALSRYVRALAADPKDFQSLVGAGRAALEIGDTQAAAGFFARADEVNPRSPLPQAGMAAVQVANGDPAAAMPYFARAQQLGATSAMLGCDRGLAYDLLGQQANAQADYRAALGGRDAEEARRRLALSLAISGDKAGAIATIAPLSAKGDATTSRVRAFILALGGDANAALRAINAAMPGSSASVAPFLQRLPALSAGQKAAAVNLGIFPDANATATYAYSAPSSTVAASADRLADIDALLRAQNSAAASSGTQPPQAQTVQASYKAPPRASAVQAATLSKIWLQLASGPNQNALSGQFRRMRSQNSDLFEGIKGYVAEGGDRARLVVGPFRGPSDAAIFAEDLRTVGIDAFRWTSSASDRIVPLATQ